MTFKLSLTCVALIISVSAGTLFASSMESSLDARITALHSVERDQRRDQRERIARIEESYVSLFGKEQKSVRLNARPVSDLKILFQAANVAAYYTNKRSYIDSMAQDLAELEKRDAAASDDYVDLYRMWVATRNFDKASALSKKHASIKFESLPKVLELVPRGWHGPTEFDVAKAHYALVHAAARLDSEASVVVVSHPLCHFSQNAAKAISLDPRVAEIMQQRAKWLAPPDGVLNVEEFQKWNRDHPGRQWPLRTPQPSGRSSIAGNSDVLFLQGRHSQRQACRMAGCRSERAVARGIEENWVELSIRPLIMAATNYLKRWRLSGHRSIPSSRGTRRLRLLLWAQQSTTGR